MNYSNKNIFLRGFELSMYFSVGLKREKEGWDLKGRDNEGYNSGRNSQTYDWNNCYTIWYDVTVTPNTLCFFLKLNHISPPP